MPFPGPWWCADGLGYMLVSPDALARPTLSAMTAIVQWLSQAHMQSEAIVRNLRQ